MVSDFGATIPGDRTILVLGENLSIYEIGFSSFFLYFIFKVSLKYFPGKL